MAQVAFGLDVAGAVLLFLGLRHASIPAAMKGLTAVILAAAVTSNAVVATLVLSGTTSWLPAAWLAQAVPIGLACGSLNRGAAHVSNEPPAGLLGVAAACAALFALSVVVAHSFNKPHGDVDAWAIWNLKAAFLFSGIDDGTWMRLFSPEIPWSHPDYPLLLPATVARYWLLVGQSTPWMPAALSFLVLGACLLLLHAAVRTAAGRAPAHAATLILLSATYFTQHAPSQYADHHLALTVLAAAVVLRRITGDSRKDAPWGIVFLFGIILGIASSIKNEGLLAAVVFLVMYAARGARGEGRIAGMLPRLAAAVSGWLLISAPTLVMKQRFGISNDVMRTVSIDALQEYAHWGRIRELVHAISPLAVDFFLLPAIVVGGVLVCGRFRLSFTPGSTAVLAASIMLLAGYVCVLFVTPYDIEAHADAALQRLFVHAWPALVFGLGASLQPRASPAPGQTHRREPRAAA